MQNHTILHIICKMISGLQICRNILRISSLRYCSKKSPGCYRCRQYKSKKSLIQSLFHSSLHLFHYILFPVGKKYGHYFLQNYSSETALFSQYKFSIIFVKYFCTKFPRKVDGTSTFFLFCYFLFSSRMTIISFISNMVSFWGRINKSSLSTRKTVI